ncbi:hypothetical protein [Rhizorhapis sp.]|uniref:hypothetical protein n=1 Tax=Rhizorhapis sp. TaxID=1968842 RepID=UPI002B46F263|nr:hypothetical protein [Rhizorhapis sp.]HKR17436.1 hypothetical protein [Rhizorhapis sp.]
MAHPQTGYFLSRRAARLRLPWRPTRRPTTPAANNAKSAGSGTAVPPLDPPEDPPLLELEEDEDELELEEVVDEDPPKLLLPPDEELVELEPPWPHPG